MEWEEWEGMRDALLFASARIRNVIKLKININSIIYFHLYQNAILTKISAAIILNKEKFAKIGILHKHCTNCPVYSWMYELKNNLKIFALYKMGIGCV